MEVVVIGGSAAGLKAALMLRHAGWEDVSILAGGALFLPRVVEASFRCDREGRAPLR